MQPVIALIPGAEPGLVDAVEAGGGRVGELGDADVLVLHHLGAEPPEVPDPVPERVRWIQLPSAGIEAWIDSLPEGPVVTSAAGAFGHTVAEHALALMLVGARNLHVCARAESWSEPPSHSLEGATLAIVGAGGIGRALISLVAPLRMRVVAVTRRGHPVEGAHRTVAADALDDVLPEADYVVLAAPATAATRQLIDARRLGLMRSSAWLINVGRGVLVDTDALVAALDDGAIGGAGLDVTDPEPLPDGHPLWRHPRAMITPHIASTDDVDTRDYARRVRENVARFAAGEELLGVVDRAAGY